MANAAIISGLIGAADNIESINSDSIKNISIPQLGNTSIEN
jgi:hypothetical protein